jgi:SET and MYND domain-containing protein
MQPSTRDFLTSPYFTLLQTHNGGRSLFATLPIPANTLIHISHSPSASVIYREYRKFVCAWCFGYKDEGRGGWCMTNGEHNGGRRFCAETCRDFWIAEGMRCGGLKERVDKAIDAAVHRMNKYRARSKQTQSHADFALPDNTLEITQATLDAAWKAAHCEATTIIQLNEMELEIARFVSSALVHLYTTSLKPVTFDDHRSILLLQQNELPHTLQRPYILPAHIRISKFLRTALACIPEMRTYISMEADGDCWVRRILGRDAGNSFGIWEQAPDGDHGDARMDGDKEMFGWGIWVDASFFNHSKIFLDLFRTSNEPRLQPLCNPRLYP